MRVGARVLRQRLEIGVGDDELDAVEAGAHHAVDGVAAAAADADDLDARALAPLGFELESQRFEKRLLLFAVAVPRPVVIGHRSPSRPALTLLLPQKNP